MKTDGKAENLLGEKWRQEVYREKHRGRIVEAVKGWAKSRTKRELFELGQAMQFPWACVDSPRDVLQSPQLKARGFFSLIAPSRGGPPVSIPRLPYQFSGFSPPPLKRAPSLGEHNRQVLTKLAAGGVMSRRRGSGRPAKSGNILRGIRVVDLTRMLSGPYATRVLGDFGAEVIKVQSKPAATGAEQNDTPYFSAWNRNKRSITLNLGRPEARKLFMELVAVSDIVVENFSPRVLANWGLTYECLKKVKPDLIMASVSAMGQTGPWKDFVGFAPTFHALSGLTSATFRKAPVDLGYAYGDVIAGLYAALAILSAMEHKAATGEGQYIDLSAYEAMCTLLGPAFMEAARGRLHEDNDAAPCGCYPCMGSDRWCTIAVCGLEQWDAFCRIRPEFAAGRFSTPAGRRKHRAELDALVARWTSRHTAETIVQRLQQAGIPAGVVQNAEDLARDAQLASRRFFVSLKHPALGTVVSDRSALWPWREKRAGWQAAPRLGQDNRYVFVKLLSHSDANLQSLVKRGIIG